MSRTHTIEALLVTAFISALGTNQAYAVQRTHVSAAIGNDINTASNCAPVAPCRTFQAAMGVTDQNGEVVVLDSGGYGAVTITQSVSIIAPNGVYAGISVFPNVNGVTIATPGINVVLRGLTINGQGGKDGINMSAGNRLTIENCAISNLGGNGIVVNGITTVRISDTTIRGNAFQGVELLNGARGTITRSTVNSNGGGGILTQGSFANTITTADIADSTISQNQGIGVSAVSQNASAVIKVSVRNSRAIRNSTGLAVFSTTGTTASLSASGNIVSDNLFGIAASGASANVWASDNLITDNGTGFKTQGAIFKSAHDNVVRNNNLNIEGTLFPIAKK
jgi:Right handed beta helix region